MSERKTPWTEGPWEATASGDNGQIPITRPAAKNMATAGKTLAWVSAPVFPAKPGETDNEWNARHNAERDANAHLISKTPEMVELLERLVEGPPHWDKDGMHEEDLRNDARTLLDWLKGDA